VSDTTSNAAPGWYPDANAPGGQRWWDGSKWTEHVGGTQPQAQQVAQPGAPQQPQPYQVFAPLKAPEGTKTNTVWIWLVVLLPLLSLISIFTIDISGYLRGALQNPGSTSGTLELYTSPGFLISTLGGWVILALTIVFSFLDWRALKARGVPSPFHWAFSFLAIAGFGIVYPIGRSIVARSRTGNGMAPMWVAIGVYALTLIVSVIWTISLMNEIFTLMPSYVTS
jgi:hypothetical protein